MKSLLPIIALNLGSNAFATPQTFELDSDANLAAVHVLLGHRSGCSAYKVEMDYRFDSDGTLVISREPNVLDHTLDFLKNNISAGAYEEVKLALFPSDFNPPMTCMAYVPIYGEVFVSVNPEQRPTLTVDFESEGEESPTMTLRQFKGIAQ